MQKNAHEILVFATGGTIEKTYNEFDGSLENRGTSIKNRIVSKLRLPTTFIEVRPLMSKDSLYMTDDDRKIIYQNISENADGQKPIVVLHGTDTMTVTAEFCQKQIQAPKVPIVFTGAMIPMGFEDSDATQNVTEALYATRFLTPGFYISFHNQIFEVPNVQKNKEKSTFETKGARS
ncbi:MAG: asparaginase [Bdellovibrio sp. 28-41-41]|nr:MAG: asparaginase [Bdellovibrio sp. 28-41-41]